MLFYFFFGSQAGARDTGSNSASAVSHWPEHCARGTRSGILDQGILDQGILDQGILDQGILGQGYQARGTRSRDTRSRDTRSGIAPYFLYEFNSLA